MVVVVSSLKVAGRGLNSPACGLGRSTSTKQTGVPEDLGSSRARVRFPRLLAVGLGCPPVLLLLFLMESWV